MRVYRLLQLAYPGFFFGYVGQAPAADASFQLCAKCAPAQSIPRTLPLDFAPSAMSGHKRWQRYFWRWIQESAQTAHESRMGRGRLAIFLIF